MIDCLIMLIVYVIVIVLVLYIVEVALSALATPLPAVVFTLLRCLAALLLLIWLLNCVGLLPAGRLR